MSCYEPRDHGARCDICPLGGRDREFVPPSPPESGKVKLIIVGMSPGAVEMKMKRPFVGPSGKLLDRTLENNGGRDLRKDAFITNSALCQPQGDRDHDASAVCCAPRLYREIEEVTAKHGPVPIWALGKSAARSILNVRSIILSRGFVWTAKEVGEESIKAAKKKAAKSNDAVDLLKAESLELRAKLAGRVVFPMLHPAFVMRSDTWHPLFGIDVDRAIRFQRGQFTLKDVPLVPTYRVVCKPMEVDAALKKMGPEVGMDIETSGRDPRKADVRCVSLSDAKHILVIAGTREDAEESGAWDKRRLAPILTKHLRRWKRVVFHNGYNFDLIALERDGVVFSYGKGGARVDDTLIGHHTYASHLPQKMDQVVSEVMTSEPWKIIFGRRGAEEKGLAPHMMPPVELYKYAAADGWRQHEIWKGIQGNLVREWKVYEHDIELAKISKAMQIRGFAVDVARKEEIRRTLKNQASALKGIMRKVIRKQSFSPAKLDHVRQAIYGTLKAPKLVPTSTGMPSTSMAAVQAFAGQDTRLGEFCRHLLSWRGAQKVRGTYLDAIEVDLEADGVSRSHFNWRIYGTVSGRWSSRMQSVPRWVKNDPQGAVREIYVASPGCELLYYDLSQSEMRAAAFLSGDPVFIETCAMDVHAGNAAILFPRAAEKLRADPKDKEVKKFRDIAKNAGFGILYSAKIDTIFQFLRGKGFDVTFADVQAMFDLVHRKYRVYYTYCERNLAEVCRLGYMRTALMQRISWIGWHPDPGEVYNRVVQSFIADLMNLRLIEIYPRMPRGCHVLGQYHDALIFEAPCGEPANTLHRLVKDQWAEPVKIPHNGLELTMPIDLKRGDRWSQF